jgi:hypothetical protein
VKRRLYNNVRALLGGYFWLPCRGCGQHFGGHEILSIAGHANDIPVSEPNQHYISRYVICPDCTRDGVGDRAWEEWHAQAATD